MNKTDITYAPDYDWMSIHFYYPIWYPWCIEVRTRVYSWPSTRWGPGKHKICGHQFCRYHEQDGPISNPIKSSLRAWNGNCWNCFCRGRQCPEHHDRTSGGRNMYIGRIFQLCECPGRATVYYWPQMAGCCSSHTGELFNGLFHDDSPGKPARKWNHIDPRNRRWCGNRCPADRQKNWCQDHWNRIRDET